MNNLNPPRKNDRAYIASIEIAPALPSDGWAKPPLKGQQSLAHRELRADKTGVVPAAKLRRSGCCGSLGVQAPPPRPHPSSILRRCPQAGAIERASIWVSKIKRAAGNGPVPFPARAINGNDDTADPASPAKDDGHTDMKIIHAQVFPLSCPIGAASIASQAGENTAALQASLFALKPIQA